MRKCLSNDGDRTAVRRLCRLSLIPLILACLLWPAADSPAQSPATEALSATVQEYRLKAAYLLNFARFVEWPVEATSPEAPLVIIIIGNDPFGSILDQTILGKTAHSRPLSVQRVSELADIKSCDILFVSRSEKKRLGEVMKIAASRSILTVSEMDDFLNQGGIVKFIIENNKLRFEVNMRMARQNGLKISSKLLSLAKEVLE